MTAPHQTELLRAMPAGACLTLDELEALTAMPRKPLKQALGKLLARDLVERARRGCYQLTPAGHEAQVSGVELTCAPQTYHRDSIRHKDTLRSRAWAALRMKGCSFTVADIVALVARGEADPEGEVRRYLKALCRAGYLYAQRRGDRDPSAMRPGAGPARYIMIKNTGPAAPIVSRRGAAVRDPNTGEVVSCRP